MKRKKRLPLGISDFKKLISEGYVYVDKTLLIPELWNKGGEVFLFPRPRRFGKTLNLSMLRYFFENTEEDNSFLFHHLKVWQDPECRPLQGKFPVIFLSLKDVKYASWEETFASIRGLIAEEFQRHRYLLEALSPEEKKQYQQFLSAENDIVLMGQSLRLLIIWLHRYHQKRVILLIDEYDTPAHAAYVGGYYDLLISFLRNWLSGGLKDNSSLERGVLTGILRIAKESIFSGLNNISTFSVLDESFADKFGLVEEEVIQLLHEYSLQSIASDVKDWYNGYRVGSHAGIYNPWSVLKCIDGNGALSPYWINTSDNALVRKLITQGAGELKAGLEEMLKGGVVEQKIGDGIVFTDLEMKPDLTWVLLLFSGYLTIDTPAIYGTPLRLRIPNLEVGELYRSMILDWFKTGDSMQYRLLLDSLIAGDIETFSAIFQDFVLSACSIFDVGTDEPEKVYHAFVLGMLLGLQGLYEVKSNRESGYGRYDVCLLPKNPNDLGIILEFKKISRFEKISLDTAAENALRQIKEKQYDQEFLDRGISRVLHLGIAFSGKKVLIRHA